MQREHFPLNDVLVGLHTGLTDTEIEETENPSLAERLPVDRKGMGMDPLLLLRLEILPEFCLTNAVLGRLAIIRGCFHLLLCPKSPTWFTIGDPLMLVHTNSSQVSMDLLKIHLHHPFPFFQIPTWHLPWYFFTWMSSISDSLSSSSWYSISQLDAP